MRRKVLQDHIKGFCTCAAESPGYYDTPRILHDGPGNYSNDILSGRTMRNGIEIPPHHGVGVYQKWLNRRAKIDNIDVKQLRACVLDFDVDVASVGLSTFINRKYNHTRASIRLAISSTGHISTDEKTYYAKAHAENTWAIGGWESYYRSLMDLLDQYPYGPHQTIIWRPL